MEVDAILTVIVMTIAPEPKTVKGVVVQDTFT